jgi:hypothetical protein
LRGAATVAANPSSAGSKSSGAFKAPLLERLLGVPGAADDPAPRMVTLDLGAVSQPLLERLASRGPCRVEIADFVASEGLPRLREAESPEEARAFVLERLLPPSREPVNLILAWDLPNYLTLDALTGLFAALGTRAAPRCKLHMLIAYAAREMAAEPGRFLPDDDGRLINLRPSGAVRPAPRYSPEDLGRAVGPFRYERGVLLANGMQEFVYALP